jgi:hypothetical protein
MKRDRPRTPKRRGHTIVFKDHPEFTPNLTPYEIFSQGAFGGTYWRRIHSGVTSREYSGLHHKYKWDLPETLLSSPICDVAKNKYRVASGTSLVYWEGKGWINPQDPYGWVQWYCEFYNGRRSDDDERQIARWLAFAGPKGRFLRRLAGMIGSAKKLNDYTISPVIRQGLHQWAKVITEEDL